jgi:hexosaminidase
MKVEDEPHYVFRGMLVDVARNFHSKEFILSLLDQMAAYKLNKLHLPLGDDEAWRLEIPSLPELTDIGGQRCFDTQEEKCLISQLGAGVDTESPVNGFYSVSDYTEILKAATARHIQVIPSLDMPGHSRSSVKAMQARYNKYMALEDEVKAKEFLLYDELDTTKYSSVQFYNDNTINVCMESSYAFITEVMTQVQKIHVDAGQPLTRYHIGADETAGAWVESPICKAFIENNSHGVTDIKDVGAYFIERVAGILSDLGIETAGWSDGMSHTKTENMPAIVQANAWDVLFWSGHDKVNELANRNWQIVISTPDALYFDFPYEASPKEFGYYWAGRQVNTEKVFQFMPDNLPIHAEFWLDREDNAFVSDDTKAPMAAGKKYLGIQGQLWSENTRTDEIAEHKVFPRLLALAERAWHLPTWAVPYNYEGAVYSQETSVFTDELKAVRNDKWRLFANTLGQKEFAKLELDSIDYRLPTVGAVIEKGILKANIAFPGLNIEYQDESKEWKRYTKPVAVKGAVNVRSRSINGLRASRTTPVGS